MPAKRIKPLHRELKVVLDTNALYTGSASYFIRKEVADLIAQNANLSDLNIHWIVPEVVRHERQFQMLQEATQMLPTIERLERLLGHNLNITAEILERRVGEAVDRQVQEHGIAVQSLKADAVDWPRLMLDAAYRKPPFQAGEKEKGFRDALILETFLQLVATESSNRSIVRLVLVSNDRLLQEAVQGRLGSATNVHILDSIDALKGLINTLGSAVDEQFITGIEPHAAEVFFRSKDETTLYYKASVGTALTDALTKAPVKLPNGSERYEIEKWSLSRPRFVKKQGQRIYWVSRFDARLKALKSVVRWQYANPVTLSVLAGVPKLSAPVPFTMARSSVYSVTSEHPSTGGLILQPPGEGSLSVTQTLFNPSEDQVVGYGTAYLDVSWSLSVTTAGRLTKPQLDSVQFVEAVWG